MHLTAPRQCAPPGFSAATFEKKYEDDLARDADAGRRKAFAELRNLGANLLQRTFVIGNTEDTVDPLGDSSHVPFLHAP